MWRRIIMRQLIEGPIGLPSGISELDNSLGDGWNRQELSYLVGDSGVGKSWMVSFVALQGAKYLAEHPEWRPHSGYMVDPDGQEAIKQEQVATKENKQPLIVIWSLEMPELPVVVRMTCQVAKMITGTDINSGLLKRGKWSENQGEEQLAAQKAYDVLCNTWGKYLYFDFDSRTVTEFCALLSDLILRYDVCLVLIDYFRKIEEVNAEGSAEVQSNKSRDLSDIAKFFDTHVCAVFDVTRVGEMAKQIRPEHMKGGTAAKYDADIVLIMEEYVVGQERADRYERQGVIDLSVAKNRMGETGTIRLTLDRATGWFALR